MFSLPAIPTSDDILRAFSCDFFSKLLATSRKENAFLSLLVIFVEDITVNKNIKNNHHE
jgi:hypothetical protein